MFTSLLFRVVLRNGLIAGVLIAVFAYLKNEWLLTGHSPDLLLTLIALLFVSAGFLLRFPEMHLSKENAEDMIIPLQEVSGLSLLSKRETDVYMMLHSGCSNKEIAGMLCIEISTVKSHINTIYKKLEVKNRRELKLKYPGGAIVSDLDLGV